MSLGFAATNTPIFAPGIHQLSHGDLAGAGAATNSYTGPKYANYKRGFLCGNNSLGDDFYNWRNKISFDEFKAPIPKATSTVTIIDSFENKVFIDAANGDILYKLFKFHSNRSNRFQNIEKFDINDLEEDKENYDLDELAHWRKSGKYVGKKKTKSKGTKQPKDKNKEKKPLKEKLKKLLDL